MNIDSDISLKTWWCHWHTYVWRTLTANLVLLLFNASELNGTNCSHFHYMNWTFIFSTDSKLYLFSATSCTMSMLL